MIKRAFFPDELAALPKSGIEAQKIRALLLAYGTKYDFCRFFFSENIILCEMDGCLVISELSEDFDVRELADFVSFCGFSEIFCSERLGERLAKNIRCNVEKINLMCFHGERVFNGELEKSPPLDKLFKIIKSSFDIDYGPWYTDMSHRIRHGVAKARTLDGSALIVQHDLNGEALLSQIATLPECRRQGNAARLIRVVCGELSESSVYILCTDTLRPFYEKVGFVYSSTKMILRS